MPEMQAKDFFRLTEWAFAFSQMLDAGLTADGMPGQQEKRTRCDACRDGTYYGAGRVENGVFIGFTAKCFRCQGKGYQTAADRRRNWGYDNYHRRVSL